MLKPKVLFDRILVKRDTPEEITKSGIIIPSRFIDKQLTGTVYKVGPDTKYIKENDKVLVEKFGGDDVNINDQDYLMITEAAVICQLIEEV